MMMFLEEQLFYLEQCTIQAEHGVTMEVVAVQGWHL